VNNINFDYKRYANAT